ncbi:TRIC cation channel family protein [Brevibacterium sp. 50QC2O2]|uniref:trimeric intracellular cation channel family protein n=1 Tax=Brevibacterium sp. 50QC2O2 TaxID=2968459 RepID=UPI00211C11F0|nr:TRIC cation channel family protein [Brevibacterium sp. 50QC2O2]
MDSQTILLILDLAGVFAFALSGNLLAARLNIDITGGLVLGALAGLGGGIVRDVILVTFPVTLANPLYLIPPVLSTVFVYFLGQRVLPLRTLIIVFDALGLSLFCMTSVVRVLDFEVNVPAAIVLGLITCCGGGLLRDVVANELPAVFNGSDLYMIPSAVGCALTAAVCRLDWFNLWTGLIIAALVFAFRMTAWKLQWHVPSPMRQWSYQGLRTRRRSRTDDVFRGGPDGQ